MSFIEFFIVTENDLNGMYMVHSKCDQIVHCYAFKGRKEAHRFAGIANQAANSEYQKHKPEITWNKGEKHKPT